jgi:hypothetical protein
VKRTRKYISRVAEKKYLKKTRKRKSWVKERNIRNNKKKPSKPPKIKNDPIVVERKVLIVPSDFSLLSNRENVLQFFKQCKQIVKNTYRIVHFRFENVQNIGSGSMTILLSICGWLNDQGISVSGSYPNNPKARLFLESSGFLRYFKSKTNRKSVSSKNAILTRGITHTSSDVTAKQVRAAMKTVWDEDLRNPRLQGMLIELMANTVNHAYENSKHQKGWYLSVNHEPDKRTVKFAFVDNGKGILNTIKLKLKDSVAKTFGGIDDSDILGNAFDGEYGSRTKLSYRGRGLPVIQKNHQQNVIKGLKVISNNVFLDFTTGKAEVLNHDFDGTFYYWELDSTCTQWNLK